MKICVVALVIFLGAPRARAETPFQLNPVVDHTLNMGFWGFTLFSEILVKPQMPVTPCKNALGELGCDRGKLNALDRTVAGRYAPEWGTISDVSLIGAGVGAVSMLAVHNWNQGHLAWRDFGADLTVFIQAFGAATVATNVMKYAWRRPRPTQYSSTPRAPYSVNQYMSFPSGHTSATAAISAAYATTYWLRYPHAPSRFAIAAGAAALTLWVGACRVASGAHFYSDVLAGAAVGGVLGVVVPYPHKKLPPSVHVSLANPITVSGVF